MRGSGLVEVEDPSQVLLGHRDARPSGVVVAAAMEGMRPLLIEVQALVSSAVYGTPQRSATGFDLRRMNMLLAVLEKRCGLPSRREGCLPQPRGGLPHRGARDRSGGDLRDTRQRRGSARAHEHLLCGRGRSYR
jgi:DNA repair protein RadA/Sms